MTLTKHSSQQQTEAQLRPAYIRRSHPMFLKNSGYKPRQASQSAGSDATDAKEVRQPVQTTNVQSAQPENNAAAGRRRVRDVYQTNSYSI